MSSALAAQKRDVRVIGLVGVAHLFSHLYQLALPPLFPLIRAETGISYTALGALIGVFYITSGIFQTPAGFLVDRFGARTVLVGGLALLAGAVAVFGLSPSYGVMLVLAFLGGLGNAVFHPADYAILTATVSDSRMGRAYSVHSIGGHLGYAAAPAVMVTLGAALGWRGALAAIGLVGIALVAILLLRMTDGAATEPAAEPETTGQTLAAGVRLLMQRPMIMLFGFFVLFSMALIGMQTFTPAALVALRGFSLASANLALAGFLVGAPSGILIGGVIADRIRRHNAVAVTGNIGAAVMILCVGLTLPDIGVMVAMLFVAGLSFGMSLPSRDMVVRGLAPPGASGKVFGFVYSGLDTGAAFTPVLFGWFVDIGHPLWIFLCAPVLFALAAGMIVATERVARRAARPLAAE